MNPIATDMVDYTLQYRPELGIGIARWLDGSNDARLRHQYAQLLALAVQENCHRWLLDLRRRAPSPQLTTGWVLGEFIPELARRLPVRPRLVFLVSPHRLGALGTTPRDLMERMRTHYVDLLVTDTEKAAHAFLFV